MREIKFRAKGVDGKWWYGSIKPDTVHYRNVNLASFFSNLHAAALLPETVGEYTGLKDRNGVEIYEGDIVSRRNKPNLHCLVYFDDRDFGYRLAVSGDKQYDKTYPIMFADQVIGNIYEGVKDDIDTRSSG